MKFYFINKTECILLNSEITTCTLNMLSASEPSPQPLSRVICVMTHKLRILCHATKALDARYCLYTICLRSNLVLTQTSLYYWPGFTVALSKEATFRSLVSKISNVYYNKDSCVSYPLCILYTLLIKTKDLYLTAIDFWLKSDHFIIVGFEIVPR